MNFPEAELKIQGLIMDTEQLETKDFYLVIKRALYVLLELRYLLDRQTDRQTTDRRTPHRKTDIKEKQKPFSTTIGNASYGENALKNTVLSTCQNITYYVNLTHKICNLKAKNSKIK